MTRILRSIIDLFIQLTSRERRILAILIIVLTIGIAFLGYQKLADQTILVAASGGQYIEGISGSRSQLAEAVTRITSVGLVSLNTHREFVPVLAKEWSISPDGKSYTFHLQDNLDSNQLAAIAREEEIFRTVEIKTPDTATLVFSLKQPFGPFLSLLALPIFPYGPFQVAEEKENEILLTANKDFALGPPFLDQIVVRIFPDEEKLRQAIYRKELTGALVDGSISGWNSHKTKLPRKILAIFNTDKELFRDPARRLQLISGQPLPEKTTLNVVTTPQLKPHADELKQRWNNRNIDIVVNLVEDAKLREETIPKRDYDILIYGLDFGIEPDPYRFWHSSQAGENGLNLAQLKDKGLDSLLEEARKIVDDRARFSKYEEINKKLDELGVMMVLEEVDIVYQVSNKIKGVEEPLMVTPSSRYDLVWKWYTKERRVPKKDQ